MAARWQMIPQKVLTEEKRKKVADSWMAAQRARMSQEWQDRQLGQAGGQVGTEQPAQPDLIQQANDWMAKALPTAAKSAIPLVGPGLAMGDIAGKAVGGALEGYQEAVPRRIMGEFARPDAVGGVLRKMGTPGQGVLPMGKDSTDLGTIMSRPDVQQVYQEQGPQAAWKYASEKYLPGGEYGAMAFEAVADPSNLVPIPAGKGAQLVGKGAELAKPLLKGAIEKAPQFAGREAGKVNIGTALDIGGAGIGAGSQYDPNATPEENLKNMLLGGAVGFGATRALRDRKLGMTIEDVTKKPLPFPTGSTKPPIKPPITAGLGMGGKEGFAGNIRLEKYPEELQGQIKAAFEAAPEKFEAARRGVIPDAQVREQAKALVESVGGKFEKMQKTWQKGQAWNAEEVLVLREVLASKTKAVVEAQQAARQSDSTENLAKLQLALQEQAATQEQVAGVTAEAGRALRQFRQTLSGAIASGDQVKMTEILNKLGGRGKTEEIAKGLSMIDLNDQEAVYKFVRNATKPEFGDYLTEIFYNSILSGPRTHIVNGIGNTLSALMAPIERGVAGGIDVAMSAATGAPRARFVGEVKPEVFGMARGIPEGVTKALHILAKGYSLDDVAKLELRRPQAFKGKLGTAINMPGRFLAASDALFRSVNYSGALNAGAYRMARQEGLKGERLASRIAELLADPPKALMDDAGKMSTYRVFQAEPGQVTQLITKARDLKTVGGIQPLRFVIPFLQTPANLLKYGLERSPAGLLNPKMWKGIAKQSPEAVDQMSRALVGSTIAAAVAMYAADGKITGAVPTSPSKRDAFYRSGKQPYSIQIGDKWVPYSRMEPFNQPLSQVAAVVEAIRNDEAAPTEIAGQVAASIGKNLVSQTYLSGLSDLMNAIQDPERYGSNVLERLGVAMAVPFSAATRTVAQGFDPTIRKPEGIGEEIMASVPGLSQRLPARLNAFGEPIKREAPAWSPINVTTESKDPVEAEMSRLNVGIGFTGDSIQGVPLSREQKAQYQQLAGRVAKRLLDRIVVSPVYGEQDDITKAKILERIIRQSRDTAAEEMINQIVAERLRQK